MKKKIIRGIAAISALLSTALLPSHASAQIITTVAGDGTNWTSATCDPGDGLQATSLTFTRELPSVSVDAAGNLIIVDRGCSTLRKVNTSGVLSTLVGAGGVGYSGDGGPATAAHIDWADYVIHDAAGNIFLSDQGNSAVRKINPAGIISNVAGHGPFPGALGDGGPATAASVDNPTGLTFDAAGNLYICSYTSRSVRKVNMTTGMISTVAGGSGYGYSGDGGPATAAKFSAPQAVAFDAAGNMYIADMYNNNIRKVNTSGIISTFAGATASGFAGDGGPASAARFTRPTDIRFDAAGNLYIADQGNERIRVINTSGIVSTVAGCGIIGFSGDGGPATAAKLFAPTGLDFDAAGNLYIADDSNSTVRKITFAPVTTGTPITSVSELSVYPNPATGSITLTGTLPGATGPQATLQLTDMLGRTVYQSTITANAGAISTTLQLPPLPTGPYLLRLTAPGSTGTRVRKLQIQQ